MFADLLLRGYCSSETAANDGAVRSRATKRAMLPGQESPSGVMKSSSCSLDINA
jgi:hypothetical protein